jgi:hypothetical protein
VSNRALTWAFEQELKSGPKFVLVALADWADDEGSCFPGVATIARRVGSVESAVRENLARLKAAGLIVEERRNRRNGARTSNRYWLQMTGQVDLTPESGGGDLEPESDEPNAGIRPDLTPESGGESEPPVVNPQTTTRENPPTPQVDRFEQAWLQWPRKVGKKAALKAWPAALRARGSVDDLILDVTRFGAAYSKYPPSKQAFIPHLSSWLNGERWTDPLPVAGPANAVQVGQNLYDRLLAEEATFRGIEQ